MAPPQSDRRFANTLARGLNILRAFRPTDDGLSNQEISERTSIPKPTVSRLTFTLCALGYLTHGRRHDKYRLGPAALALGNIAASSFSFVEAASPLMQALADETATLIGIGIQDDGRMLIAKTWRPVGSPSIWLDAGYRMPILESSTGKAYLGALSGEEFEQFVDGLTGELAGQRPALETMRNDAQNEIIARGYAFTKGEQRFSETINAMAVPYRPSEFGEPVAFLSGAPTQVLTDEKIEKEVGPALARAVGELQRMTGQQHALRMSG